MDEHYDGRYESLRVGRSLEEISWVIGEPGTERKVRRMAEHLTLMKGVFNLPVLVRTARSWQANVHCLPIRLQLCVR